VTTPFLGPTLRPFLTRNRRADLVALRDLVAGGRVTRW
jgi:hypothetical protein